MIHRELPLTSVARPAEPVAGDTRGFSYVRASAAADSAIGSDGVVHALGFCFLLYGKFLLLPWLLSFPQPAIGCLAAFSTLTPMAQMKLSSSRPSGDDLSSVFACRRQP